MGNVFDNVLMYTIKQPMYVDSKKPKTLRWLTSDSTVVTKFSTINMKHSLDSNVLCVFYLNTEGINQWVYKIYPIGTIFEVYIDKKTKNIKSVFVNKKFAPDPVSRYVDPKARYNYLYCEKLDPTELDIYNNIDKFSPINKYDSGKLNKYKNKIIHTKNEK